MTDLDPTTILRERYEALAARRIELREELDPLELEMARLQAGLRAMGALDIPEVVRPRRPLDEQVKLELVRVGLDTDVSDLDEYGDLRAYERAKSAGALPRLRHPDLQAAIDQQAPSVAVPAGTKLYCRDGCVNGDAGGFGDQMALRTHTKRRHDREPTEQEKVPR